MSCSFTGEAEGVGETSLGVRLADCLSSSSYKGFFKIGEACLYSLIVLERKSLILRAFFTAGLDELQAFSSCSIMLRSVMIFTVYSP